MTSRWLYDLLTNDVRPCPRCKGSGRGRHNPRLYCGMCWGYGFSGLGIVLRYDAQKVERVCIHGIGHTVLTLRPRDEGIHGCDGCCAEYAYKEIR